MLTVILTTTVVIFGIWGFQERLFPQYLILLEGREWLIPSDAGNYQAEWAGHAGTWRGIVDRPNTTTPYVDFTRGISVEIPYNNRWGNEQFQLPPFEIDEEGVRFGPVVGYCEGGGGCRSMWLRKIPQRSVDRIIEEHTSVLLDIYPAAKTVDGFDVVQWIEAATGAETYYAEIVGPDANYLFRFQWAWDKGRKRWQYAEQILDSFRFLSVR